MKMDMDEEVALMYASTPFGIFHPRTSAYSPFENVVLRVVRPRPQIEDLVSQLLGGLESTGAEQAPDPPLPQQDESIGGVDQTPYFDISERMAREMQEQEDREQMMRDRRVAFGSQMGDFMSSVFGGFRAAGDVAPSGFRQQNVNAEAGPSTIKQKPSFTAAPRPNGNMPGSYPITASEEAILNDSSKSAGKQRVRSSSPYNLNFHSDSMDLLNSVEASLKHEVNKFDFPERLDFLNSFETSGESSPSRTPPTPVLAHTINNASVHAHEQELLDLLASLDEAANDAEEDVRMRRLILIERIKREMDHLDRKVLELWAASRRSVVDTTSQSHTALYTIYSLVGAAGMNRPEQFTKVDLTPKRHHGYSVLLFIFGTFFPPLAVAARFGIGGDFWLNLLLTICGYFPGHGHNFYIQNIRNNKNHRRTPKWALRYGLIDDTEIQRKKKRSQWANRYDERLPQSALEGQEYEEGQNANETPRNERNDPFARRDGDPALWNEDEDENYYNGRNRPRSGSLQNDSQSSISNRRWHYPANFNAATEVEGMELDGRKGKGKKKSSKRGKDKDKDKDKKDRWGRTADAHAGVGYEDVDSTKKKKKKKSKTTDDSMWSNGRSDSNLPRRHSSVSDIEGPEDAVGGLYGERTALRSAEEPRRNGSDPLEHQF